MEDRIKQFQERIETDGREYCEFLYNYATIRLLAHKYAYYVNNIHFISDYGYDIEEESWRIMGRALSHLKEDETSPCIDFDPDHPLAQEGIKLAKTLKPKEV